MGGAISISANNDTATHVMRLWDLAASFETEPSMACLGYPPHFTFAIYHEIEPALLQETVHEAFAGKSPITVTFNSIEVFDVSPLVVWASPSNLEELQSVHASIHRQIDPALCHAHYVPGVWVPHCTLATNIEESRREEAMAFAVETDISFEVVFDIADWIEFPPIDIAGRLPLGAPAA